MALGQSHGPRGEGRRVVRAPRKLKHPDGHEGYRRKSERPPPAPPGVRAVAQPDPAEALLAELAPVARQVAADALARFEGTAQFGPLGPDRRAWLPAWRCRCCGWETTRWADLYDHGCDLAASEGPA